MRIKGLGLGNIGGVNTDSMVDSIMQAESIPVETAKQRRGKVVAEKNEFNSFQGMIDGLGKSLDGLRTENSFSKLKVESSHPDLLDGVAGLGAKMGSYELEIENIARQDRHVAFGFQDIDKTEVGFGYLAIDRGEQGALELQIDPGSTMKDVAAKINSAKAGVRAELVNTGISDEPFRLLVSSEKTGEAARISIDPDTTFFDFKNNVVGSNMKAKFEDVEIQRPDNKLENLVEGLKLDVKNAAPGTKIQINVTADVDKTFEGIKAFTDQYNKISDYAKQQSARDPSTGEVVGKLPGNSSVKQVMRTLQNQISSVAAPGEGSAFNSLADIGITTNAKTGGLELNEQKLKEALGKDYASVTKIFTRSEDGIGVAERLSQAVKNLQDSQSGPIKSRVKSLDNIIKGQDKAIEAQTERLDKRKEVIQRQFQNLNVKMAGLENQQAFISARMGTENEAPAASKKSA